MKKLEEVIAISGSVIFADEDLGVLITWNGSAMLNWWSSDWSGRRWENTDVRTNYNLKTLADAEKEAAEWFAEDTAELVD